MAATDPRVDAYIESSADFAKPILRHVREVVHAACPDVEETIKWGFPHFDYRGIMMRPEAVVPDDLAAALEASPAAAAAFQGFSPSHRREYVEWITEAKREATRAKRVAQAVAWLAEGKPRNWKYT